MSMVRRRICHAFGTIASMCAYIASASFISSIGALSGREMIPVTQMRPNGNILPQAAHRRRWLHMQAAPAVKPQHQPDSNAKRVIMKFGGSSLANAERIDHVSQLIRLQIGKGLRPTIVCSAMGKTTNNLLSAGGFALEGNVRPLMTLGHVFIDALRTLHLTTAKELSMGDDVITSLEELLGELKNLLSGVSYLRELTPRTLDYLVSFGERLAVRIVAARLNQLGVPAQAFESWTLGLRTTSDFGSAEVLQDSYASIRESLHKLEGSMIAVVTGFIGQDSEGRITTLGRGGSDLTASTLGAATQADEIQVWKDVNGIMTADPRVVPDAVPVPCVTFEEASELAYFGAEILHPISMVPAMRHNVPVRVKNSYNPEHPGTLIQQEKQSANLVTAITSKRRIDLLDIVSTWMLGQYGFLGRVFSIFEDHKISVDCVATSEVSISLTLDKKVKDAGAEKKLIDELSGIAAVTVHPNRAIISLIANVARSSEVLKTVFEALQKAGSQVEMLSQGASKVNISLIVKDEDAERCTKILHDSFFATSQPGKTTAQP